jgi:hypothetical protein
VSKLARVGAHAAWHLDFRTGPELFAPRVLVLGSGDYFTSIEATLPAGLDGGSYQFIVEGLTNEDYARLYRAMADAELIVRLHLYWRDGGVAGYFVDLAGLTDVVHGDEPPEDTLVAVLRVTSLKRRAGTRRYEVVIDAREQVYHRLLSRLAAEGTATDLLDAVRRIAKDDNVAVPVFTIGEIPTDPGQESSTLERSWAKRDVAIDRLRQLGNAMESRTKRYGLGMYQIRDGMLIAGPDRHRTGTQHDELDADSGLIQIESRGHEVTDPNFVPRTSTEREPRRAVFELTLRGRPDIKPGDYVVFTQPPEESPGPPTSFSLDLLEEHMPGAKVMMYVRGVTHRLARELGFVTTVRGISFPGPDIAAAWFSHSAPKGPKVTPAAVHADSAEGEMVGALREIFDRAGGQRIDAAQVRATNVKANPKLPAQTERLWRGLVADDGRPYAAVTLDADAEGKTSFAMAPYASPFAWGKFGLVLPRYPGMRVLVGHRLGDHDDIVDLGALWMHGQAPPANPGDYWLGLPAAIPPAERESIADAVTPKQPAGKATNDLIDADGNRVVEVGTLTVRVGASLLHEGGTRPVPAAAQVQIEHQSGSKIVIDQDGNITITAAKKLDFVAGDDITFDTPKDVIVKTGGAMDVKGRT